MEPKLYPLYEIARSDLYGNSSGSPLRIPNIQRGLVWKANQVELLWDSILRGFPIGSMLVLAHEDESGKIASGEILDGQQRANAIVSGFDKGPLLGCESPKTILWYDLGYRPSDSDPNRREFAVHLTNSSHPWGYDSENTTLSAQKRRMALDKAYSDISEDERRELSLHKGEWSLRRFLPYSPCQKDDYLPIPLCFLVSAACGEVTEESFYQSVYKDIEDFSKLSVWWSQDYLGKVKQFLEEDHSNGRSLFEVFQKLNKYYVTFNYVNTGEDIEILFNRVNSKGTPMSQEDLTYAAIKHYGAELTGCDNVRDIIKEMADGLMPEANLAQIIFRFCLSQDKIPGEIDAKAIRKYALTAKDGDEDKEPIKRIKDLFKEDGRIIKELIEKAKHIVLSGNNLPSVLFTEIGMNNPTIIIMLLKLVEISDGKCLDYRFIQALVFYLYCFSENGKSDELARLVFQESQRAGDIRVNIQDIIRDSISQGWSYEPVSSFKGFKALKDEALNKDWSIDNYSGENGFDMFKALFSYDSFQGAFMLKYAQRDFYKEYFSDYNPSNKALWEDNNRPWDHDHIIPKSWVNDGEWNSAQFNWLNSWGNIADIPYEENREKNNNPDWRFYEDITKDTDTLLVKDLLKGSGDYEDGLIRGIDSISTGFLKTIRDRFIAISDDFLRLFDILGIQSELSKRQAERKRFFEILQLELPKYSNHAYHLYRRLQDGSLVPLDDEPENCQWQKQQLLLVEDCDQEAQWTRSIAVRLSNDKFRAERALRNNRMQSGDVTIQGEYKNGTYSYIECSSLVGNNEMNDDVRMFLLGADIFNKEFGANCFRLDNSGIISFYTDCQGIHIKAYISGPYYSFRYGVICSEDNVTLLPDCILNKAKEKERGYFIYDNKRVEKKLGKYNKLSYSDFFKAFIEELSIMGVLTDTTQNESAHD